MRKNTFIYMSHNMYIIVDKEELVPANKIAARVSLSGEKLAGLTNLPWREYQSLLEHYFTHGQKLVTA